MTRFVFWLQRSRPIMWPVLPTVYFLGLHSAGTGLTAEAILHMALLAWPMNLIGYGLNDIYDTESDQRNRRRRAMWHSTAEHEDQDMIWRVCWAMASLMVAGSLLTRNWCNVGATCGMLVVAWAYSAPPMRLKERPPLDSLVNGLGYYLLPFTMGYSLGADHMEIPYKHYLLAFTVCGIHAFTTISDFESDKYAAHQTFSVVFGRRAAAVFAAGTFLIALVFGEFQSVAVRVFLEIGLLVTVCTAVLLRNCVIIAASAAIFVGFFVAAGGYVMGW